VLFIFRIILLTHCAHTLIIYFRSQFLFFQTSHEHSNDTWQRLESKWISTATPKIFSLSTMEFTTEFLQFICLEASIYKLQKT